nr:unnamed protein product [Callosobruchus chinensis]
MNKPSTKKQNHSVVRNAAKDSQKNSIDSHILNNHTDNVLLMKSITNKIHCCQHCDYKAINITRLKSHLKKHELIHLETKPFGCTECGKGFALKQHLDSHILNNHTDNVLLMKSITHKITLLPTLRL